MKMKKNDTGNFYKIIARFLCATVMFLFAPLISAEEPPIPIVFDSMLLGGVRGWKWISIGSRVHCVVHLKYFSL
jgi:hypothetical protein